MDKLPVLYHKGRTGAIYQWTIWTEGSEIVTEYGQVGGKMQIARKKAESKNVGRSNETTPEQQAESEARAEWKFNVDRKYSETIESSKEQLLAPMLAPTDSFEKTKKYVKYPCDVQPKLDGMRCLAYWEDARIVLLSRGQKEYNLPHIASAVASFLPKDWMLDGELYIHGETFQEITRLVKKYRKNETEKVQYHVYDCPVSEDTRGFKWVKRQYQMQELLNPVILNAEFPVQIVKSWEAMYESTILGLQAGFIKAGYEGAIVRLWDGVYEWGYRSKSLLKVKTFDDAEWPIVGFSNGRGKNETTVKWTCALPDGRTFDCAPTGKREDRERMLAEGEQHIGKMLKVKYFGLTDDGIPRFPIGLAFREGNE